MREKHLVLFYTQETPILILLPVMGGSIFMT